jgi:hypothetical protein
VPFEKYNRTGVVVVKKLHQFLITRITPNASDTCSQLFFIVALITCNHTHFEMGPITRVTGLGEFSPIGRVSIIGRLLTFESFF